MEIIIASIIVIASFLLLFIVKQLQKRKNEKNQPHVQVFTSRSLRGSPRRVK
jgi:hypothetical protein